VDWIDDDYSAVKALDHVWIAFYAGYNLPLLPFCSRAQCLFKRSVLVHQYFRNITAKARSRDFSSIYPHGFEKLFQQSCLFSLFVIEIPANEFSMERRPVCGALPLALFDIKAWHNVYPDIFYKRLDVRVV